MENKEISDSGVKEIGKYWLNDKHIAIYRNKWE